MKIYESKTENQDFLALAASGSQPIPGVWQGTKGHNCKQIIRAKNEMYEQS
jgi:hypothetical protein